jgi:hypothetical protein
MNLRCSFNDRKARTILGYVRKLYQRKREFTNKNFEVRAATSCESAEGAMKQSRSVRKLLWIASLCTGSRMTSGRCSALDRHCEPTGPARSGRPDDKLREAIQCGDAMLDCFVASLLAMTMHYDSTLAPEN